MFHPEAVMFSSTKSVFGRGLKLKNQGNLRKKKSGVHLYRGNLYRVLNAPLLLASLYFLQNLREVIIGRAKLLARGAKQTKKNGPSLLLHASPGMKKVVPIAKRQS